MIAPAVPVLAPPVADRIDLAMPRRPDRRLTWAFAFALLLLAGNALVSYRDFVELATSDGDAARSRRRLDGVMRVGSSLLAAESARRGCWLDPTAREADDFAATLRTLDGAIADLADLARPGSAADRRLVAVVEAGRRGRAHLDDPAARPASDGPAPGAGGALDRIRRDLRELDGAIAAFRADEEGEHAAQREERRARIRRAFAASSLASTLALVAVGVTHTLVRRHLAGRDSVERAIQDSEARFRLLFESVGEGIYGVDTRGRCTFCNPAALRILGFASDREVLGRDMHRLIHHTHADGTPYPAESCPIYRTFRSGLGVLGVEDDFHRADGTTVPVEYRAHAIRRHGEILGAVVTFVDIAPRRQLEDDMHLRDRALQAIGQGVFIVDPTAGDALTYANAAFERMTGMTRGGWPGRDGDPDRPSPLASRVEELRRAVLQGGDAATEYPSARGEGPPAWHRLNLYPVQERGGRVGHLVGVLTDVTERRVHEERLRSSEEGLRLMVESVADYAIFSVDLKGNVSSWNPGAGRLFGYADGQILGRPFGHLFGAADREAEAPGMELARAREQGRSADERWHIRADGSRFLASGTTTPVRDRSGRLVGYTKVARDITRSKQAELDLRAARDAAEAAARAKNAFLSTMGHELRTPLNAIIGYSELLEEEAVERGVTGFVEDLARIREAGHLLLRLINQVFDLSRIESGGLALARERFEVADLVREAVRSVAADAERRGNALQVHQLPDPGSLVGDFAKVNQCLGHLLSNAIKFTEGGTVVLKVERREDPEARRWLVFVVEDDGIGMTRDEVARLFQPFVQGDASASRRYGGSGLGLTITSRYCRLMGGTIEVDSEPGRGSTFRMRLPDLDAPRGADSPPDGPPEPAPPRGP